MNEQTVEQPRTPSVDAGCSLATAGRLMTLIGLGFTAREACNRLKVPDERRRLLAELLQDIARGVNASRADLRGNRMEEISWTEAIEDAGESVSLEDVLPDR